MRTVAERFYYDAEEIKRCIDLELDELRRIRFSEKYGELLGDEFMGKVRDWENAIRRQKELPYTLVVCGSFKRGKSTLINAILGEDVATTDVTTETITLNRILYGEHSNALILENGKRMLLTDEQLRRDGLEAVLSGLGGGAYQLELRRPIELLKDVTIVDTPGLDDSLHDFESLVDQALLQADAVVYVLSSGYPMSIQEQLFLRTAILPQKHTDLFLVGNYADVLRNDAEYERMEAGLLRRMEVVLPGQHVHMLSALDERCRQLGADRPNPELQERLAANFDSFRSDLGRMMEEKREVLLADRMERMLRGMRTELGAMLDVMEHGLRLDREQASGERREAEQAVLDMDAKQNRVTEEINSFIGLAEKEATVWLRELVGNMSAEAGTLRDLDLTLIRKYYSIYCIDILQSGLNLCMEHHGRQLFEKLDSVSGELTHRAVKVVEHGRPGFSFILNNKTWTKGDNVGFVARYLGGGILSLVGMTVGGAMRQSEMKRSNADVFEDIALQYDKLQGSLVPTVQRAYADMGGRVQREVREFFADRTEQLRAQSELVISFAQRSEAEKEQALSAVETVRSILNGMTV